jgi:hypothetical protein
MNIKYQLQVNRDKKQPNLEYVVLYLKSTYKKQLQESTTKKWGTMNSTQFPIRCFG